MSVILACVDGSIYSQSVVEHAAWAAERLPASVELMQVLGRREANSDDRSGRIVAGARRQLLEELAALDAERAKLLMRQARLELDEATERLGKAGIETATLLRHGDLLETLAEREASAELIVIGKRGEAADFAKMHLGSNLERILRAVQKPVLISARAFRPIKRFMVAFDGRPSAMKAIEAAAASPLFKGLEAVVVTAGEASAEARAKLDEAVARLAAGGLSARAQLLDGAATDAIPQAVAQEGVDLLLMGAYGHSRLRTMMIGSTTAEVIRGSLVPVLIYR